MADFGWHIEYVDWQQNRKFGFFTKDFLERNMQIFNTITNAEWIEKPEKALVNMECDVPSVKSLSRNGIETKKKNFFGIYFIESCELFNKDKPYNPNNTEHEAYVTKAREYIGYSPATNSCDIYTSLRLAFIKLVKTDKNVH